MPPSLRSKAGHMIQRLRSFYGNINVVARYSLKNLQTVLVGSATRWRNGLSVLIMIVIHDWL